MTIDPAWLIQARAELGVRETPGPVSTKRILAYRTMAGLKFGGDDGDVAWCAIFVGAMLASVHVRGSGSAMARSYVHWGQALPEPCPGAIVALSSTRGPASGHVGFATGRWTATHVELLAGNQGDAVSIAMFPRSRVLGYRWPAGWPMSTARAKTIVARTIAETVSDV